MGKYLKLKYRRFKTIIAVYLLKMCFCKLFSSLNLLFENIITNIFFGLQIFKLKCYSNFSFKLATLHFFLGLFVTIFYELDKNAGEQRILAEIKLLFLSNDKYLAKYFQIELTSLVAKDESEKRKRSAKSARKLVKQTF